MKDKIILFICTLVFAFMIIFLTACETTNNIDDKNADFPDAPNNSDFSKDNQTKNIDAKSEEEIEDLPELIKTFDEKHRRYNFAYKRSTLSVRKEIFEQYNLVDEDIQKFFDISEIMYEKLDVLFPGQYIYPEVIAHHSVPAEWGSEPDLYDDYSEIASRTNAWSNIWTNETFYKEGLLEKYLIDFDMGYPAIVGHELGHLFVVAPYVWDSELFGYFAMFYLASEFLLIDGAGVIITPDYWKNWQDLPQWIKFFDLSDKYGYDIIGDTFKEMLILMAENPALIETTFDLFRQVLSQKTGDDIDNYFFG